MHLRDYLHDIPLKALKTIASKLDVRVEYEARIKLMNAIDRAFWGGTLVNRLMEDLSGDHHRLLSMIAFSYDNGICRKILLRKFEKVTGTPKQETASLLEDLIGYALVGALKEEDATYFCPRGISEQVRAVLLKKITLASDKKRPVPAAAPPNLLEDIASLLAVIYQEPVSLTLMGRIRKALLDKAFSGSPTCTGPYPLSEEFRNGFTTEYLKQRGLVRFEHGTATVTPKLNGWLGLSMTERFRDIISFALRHTLLDMHTIRAVTGILGEAPAGTGFALGKFAYFLHADTLSPGGFSRIESRLGHLLDIITQLGLAAVIEGRYVVTKTGEALFRGNPHPMDENVSTTFMTQPNFEIILGPETDMRVRFKLELLADRRNRDMVLTYEVTREGIARARERGMTTDEIMAFFESHTRNAIPQNVRFSIESWAKAYGCVYFEDTALMRFRDASTCGSILHIPEIAPYVVEQISDTVLVVSANNIPRIMSLIKKAGYHPEVYGAKKDKPVGASGNFTAESPDVVLSGNTLPEVRNTFIFPDRFISNGEEK